MRWLQLAAEGGDRDAQYELSILYGSGTGVAKDVARALEWLRKAAKQDQVKAQYTLAAIYAGGMYGVPRDDRIAIDWLRKSAKLGYAEAQYALGLAYAEGRGVEKDATQAYGWLLDAAKQGHQAAGAYVKHIQEKVLGAAAKPGATDAGAKGGAIPGAAAKDADATERTEKK